MACLQQTYKQLMHSLLAIQFGATERVDKGKLTLITIRFNFLFLQLMDSLQNHKIYRTGSESMLTSVFTATWRPGMS